MAENFHQYYTWQISTLMLAYNAVAPIPPDADGKFSAREELVKDELHGVVQKVLPPQYLTDPSLSFPPEIVALLSKATIQRAAEILREGRAPAGELTQS